MMITYYRFLMTRHIFITLIALLVSTIALPLQTAQAEIIACIKPNGALRIVESIEDCKRRQQAITWPDNEELETLKKQAAKRIAKLEAQNATLSEELAALTEQVADLEAQNATLSAELSCISPNSDAGDLYFEGCNVHVLNSAGSTESINGLGNLIIGYNEIYSSQQPFCSGAPYADNQADCESAGYVWAANQKTGSHNLVIGAGHSYTQYGGLVAGRGNIISGLSASVSGGEKNTASGDYSSVSGGYRNTASGDYSSVSGGNANLARDIDTSISGGLLNTANGPLSSISGGSNNETKGPGFASSISGGYGNIASGEYSSVSGGSSTQAYDEFDWAAGSLLEDQ